MYQPSLQPDQVQALYFLKLQQRRPMTKLLREAVDEYLKAQSEQYGQIVREEEGSRLRRKA
jgi:hypothetical protein